MARRWAFLVCAPTAIAAAALAACGDDDNTVTPNRDGGGDVTQPDGNTINGDASNDAQPDAPTEETMELSIVASFDPKTGQLPEGVVVQGDTPIVGFAPLGKLVKVLPDGGTADFVQFTPVNNTYTTGLALDTSNNLYAAVGATGATPTPAPGVWQVPPSGTPVLPYGASASYVFPNGLDFVGTDLYVGDSGGKIWQIKGGVASVWKLDAALVGDQNACGTKSGFDIGVNGIAHDDTYVYGVNFDKGIFFRIKRDDVDGGADASADGGTDATVEILYQNCDFAGADGLLRDSDGTFLVANNPKGRLDRVTVNGTTATFKTIKTTGAALDGPASLFITGQSPNRKLYITNSAFASASTDGGMPKPGLLMGTLSK